ncbi:hypothetical protein KIL84_013728 [Mauremys mutica]|uniref:Uncharacterized protein n=1 Tax=Mauremys mutica TaxID=74926 RepID=A0A9D4ASD7_9SAUR|nr:hypothetical protein KIL84_013728 [Mauremys mutica]
MADPGIGDVCTKGYRPVFDKPCTSPVCPRQECASEQPGRQAETREVHLHVREAKQGRRQHSSCAPARERDLVWFYVAKKMFWREGYWPPRGERCGEIGG